MRPVELHRMMATEGGTVDEFTRGAVAAIEEVQAQIVAFKTDIEREPSAVEAIAELLDEIAGEIRAPDEHAVVPVGGRPGRPRMGGRRDAEPPRGARGISVTNGSSASSASDETGAVSVGAQEPPTPNEMALAAHVARLAQEREALAARLVQVEAERDAQERLANSAFARAEQYLEAAKVCDSMREDSERRAAVLEAALEVAADLLREDWAPIAAALREGREGQQQDTYPPNYPDSHDPTGPPSTDELLGICECGHSFVGAHRTPGTECAVRDCKCGRFVQEGTDG